MEWIQPLFVLFAALGAVAFLIYKWMPKSKSKKGAHVTPIVIAIRNSPCLVQF